MAEKMATREAYGKALAEFGETYDFVGFGRGPCGSDQNRYF